MMVKIGTLVNVVSQTISTRLFQMLVDTWLLQCAQVREGRNIRRFSEIAEILLTCCCRSDGQR